MSGKMYEIQTLIAAMKKINSPNLFLYSLLIGAEKAEKTEKFEIHTKDGMRLKAPLVGKREKGKLIESQSFEKTTYSPPMIKIYTIANAENYLYQQFGQTIYGDNFTNAKQQLAEELKELKNIVSRTKLWSLAKLVTTGVLPVQEGQIGIKFGEFNSEILAGADKWDNPDTDIIDYLRVKKLELHKNSGIVLDTVVISPDVTPHLMKNKGILEALKMTNANFIHLKPEDLGNGTSYIGYIPELDMKIYSYIDWVSDDGITEEAIIPVGSVIGCKRGSFRVHYGAFPFRVKQLGDSQLFIGAEAVRKVASLHDETDELQLYSAPLIIPGDAQGWFYSKVI